MKLCLRQSNAVINMRDKRNYHKTIRLNASENTLLAQVSADAGLSEAEVLRAPIRAMLALGVKASSLLVRELSDKGERETKERFKKKS